MKYIALILVVILALPVHGVYINQILYDSIGTDTGNEWIELYANKTTSLENYTLYYSRGLEGDSWLTIWEGSGYILEDDYIIIGDFNIDADYFATLSMGNTRGSLKIEGNGYSDIVGYGETIYYSENPASLVSAGSSLLRQSFTGDNSVDFVGESNPEFNSKSYQKGFMIEILEALVDFEIVSISSVQAYPGDTVTLDVEITSDSNHLLEVAGYATNGNNYIDIVPFEVEIDGNTILEIPLDLPKRLSEGNYTGKITIKVK
jgi:uncharacterized cupredoxin-like copper-binding protein